MRTQKPKIPELIIVIGSVLEKSRDTLSDNEVQDLKEVICLLKNLEEADPREVSSNLELIVVILLRFFMKPEIVGQIVEWFEHLNQ